MFEITFNAIIKQIHNIIAEPTKNKYAHHGPDSSSSSIPSAAFNPPSKLSDDELDDELDELDDELDEDEDDEDEDEDDDPMDKDPSAESLLTPVSDEDEEEEDDEDEDDDDDDDDDDDEEDEDESSPESLLTTVSDCPITLITKHKINVNQQTRRNILDAQEQ